MRFIKDLSIVKKLILMMITSSILTLILVIATVVYFNIETIKNRAIQHLSILSEVIAERSTAAIIFLDEIQAEKNLKALRHAKYVELACLYNAETTIVGQYTNPAAHQKKLLTCPKDIKNDLSRGRYTQNHLILTQSIILDESIIGYLYIATTDAFILEEFYQGIYQYLFIIILVILFNLFIANYFQRFISRPIRELSLTAIKIADNNDFSLRAKKTNNDELGDLVDAFNQMLQQTEKYEKVLLIQKDQLKSNQEHLETIVKERTHNLQLLNNELRDSLKQVQNMQGQLIEAEKMASLGGLVAGIAHEINTPIGICLTAASFLKEQNDSLQMLYQQDEMTQDDFEAFLKTANDSSDIILKNIQRAAEIIQNFKKISVDQSVEDKRCFNVKEYFFEIIQSLHPKLKRYNHTINIISDDDIYINSYPGSLYQIFSNLILNSVIHGFEKTNNGKIIVIITCEKNQMNIQYKDNGLGMSPNILNKVFEPFVTTKRNKGGTGLGAHIIYNIVSQQLQGKITCNSVVNEGVDFNINIPVIFCQKRGVDHG